MKTKENNKVEQKTFSLSLDFQKLIYLSNSFIEFLAFPQSHVLKMLFDSMSVILN